MICAFLTAIGSGLTYKYAKQVSAQKLSERANNSLSLVAGTIQATVGRYKYLPEVIALAPEIQELFAEKLVSKSDFGDSKRIANDYLERVNSQAGSAELFVLDRDGLCLAASNWRNPKESFVDQSYSERPYRVQAMNSGDGRFYGQGKTTLIPGYFLATAIRKDDRTNGIAVVKIDLAGLQKDWKEAGEPVAVADGNGVLFLSSEEAWRYHPLRKLGAASLEAIHETKQYPDLRIEPLLSREQPYPYGTQIALNAGGDAGVARIMFARKLPALGWTLIYFGDPSEFNKSAALAATAVGLAIIAAFMGGFVIHERLRTLRVERKAKSELEARVEERTIELRDANARLMAEVEERRKTETELFRTRDRLIEAARRAALGQFLAGLVHETNQPLAALRTYLSSTRLLVSKGKTEEAATNLATMQTVLDHLSQLSGRLKMMIRGDTKELQPTNLSDCATRVISLLRPHFQQLDIALRIEIAPDIWVRGDGVRLDQILLNLLNNAADALRGRGDGYVRIRLASNESQVTLLVEDNGPGVPQQKVNRLFEPFFTTKEPGIGLGLGLATVHRIVAEHDGTIEYCGSELNGAAFRVVFPKFAVQAPLLSEMRA